MNLNSTLLGNTWLLANVPYRGTLARLQLERTDWEGTKPIGVVRYQCLDLLP